MRQAAADSKSESLASPSASQTRPTHAAPRQEVHAEPLPAFQQRLTRLLREGKADQAASQFVERALGSQATPEGCADLLEMVTEVSDWHLKTFAPAFALGDADGRSARPSRPHIGPDVAKAFHQTVGRAGSTALSRGTELLPLDHARATLAAAYQLLAEQKAPYYRYFWSQSANGRPWLDALTAGLADAPSLPSKRPEFLAESVLAAPWRMPDRRPLMQWIQATGMHSLPYALLVSSFLAHSPAGLLPGGASLLSDQKTRGQTPGFASLQNQFNMHLLAVTQHLWAEGWGVSNIAIFISAATTAINRTAVRSYSSHVYARPFSEMAVLPLMPESERARMTRLVDVVSEQLYESDLRARPVCLSRTLGLRRPAEIYAESARSMSSGGAGTLGASGAEGARASPQHTEVLNWFKCVIAELWPERFVAERQALFESLQTAPRAAALAERMGSGGAEVTDARPEPAHPIAVFYAAYCVALQPSFRQLRALRADGVPEAVRQLGEPLLVPRLATHAGIARRESEWLSQQESRSALAPAVSRHAQQLLRELQAELRGAIGDLRRWPVWVGAAMGESVEPAPQPASASASASAPAPAPAPTPAPAPATATATETLTASLALASLGGKAPGR